MPGADSHTNIWPKSIHLPERQVNMRRLGVSPQARVTITFASTRLIRHAHWLLAFRLGWGGKVPQIADVHVSPLRMCS